MLTRLLDGWRNFWSNNPSGENYFEQLEISMDILEQILLRVNDRRTICAACPKVCREWNRLLSSPSFWIAKCEYDGVPLPPVHLRKHPEINFKQIWMKRPFQRNLVANPSGERAFDGWRVRNGGNGWNMEHSTDPDSEFPVYFVTSYSWCTKELVIDLTELGIQDWILDHLTPTITVSEYSGSRWDCGCTYHFTAQLLSDGEEPEGVGQTPDTFSGPTDVFFHSKRDVQQWNDESWLIHSHEFKDYPMGIRRVIIRSDGKDTQFWRGHYGPRIAKATVTVSFA